MRIIGNKNDFAIEYELFPIEKESEKLWDQLQGTMAVYVKNKNICRYSLNGEEFDFNGVLFHVIDWLCENLSNVLGYDPYPMPVDGENLLELINSANEFETDDEIEEYLWYSSERNWIFRHSWRAVSESVISSTFFRRNRDAIEISWDNRFWKEKNIVFLFLTGSELVELETFRIIMLEFLIDLFNNIELNYKEDGFVVKGWISRLQALNINLTTNKMIKNILGKCENASLE